jgi:hypothetical protein
LVGKELEAIKARVREMEEEAEKLKQLQSEVDRQMMNSPTSSCSQNASNANNAAAAAGAAGTNSAGGRSLFVFRFDQ